MMQGIIQPMTKDDYSNRELDSHFSLVKDALQRIEAQTTKTNGRVTRLERNLLIIACILATTFIIKFPQVLDAVKIFI